MKKTKQKQIKEAKKAIKDARKEIKEAEVAVKKAKKEMNYKDYISELERRRSACL